MALAMSAEDAQPTSAGEAAAAGDGTMDAEAAAANGLSAADGPSSPAPELGSAAAEAEPDSTQQVQGLSLRCCAVSFCASLSCVQDTPRKSWLSSVSLSTLRTALPGRDARM